MYPWSRRFVCTSFLMSSLFLAIMAGCIKSPQSPPRTATTSSGETSSPAENDYVGSETCGQCHPNEWQHYQHTHHALTFRPMTVSGLGTSAPANKRFADTNCAVVRNGDQYLLANPLTGQARQLDFALGSGKQGITFVAVESEGIFEMRKSYIPRTRSWYATPGQETENSAPDVTGKLHKHGLAAACILCHAVKMSPVGYYAERKFMGVGCESCHGPGSLHIAAVNAHSRDLVMQNLHGAGGKQINTLCGKCHRTPEDVALMPVNQQMTQRFMPFGLSKSRCFKESNDRFTCITCHDPHRDASTGQASYERVCLSCHNKTTSPRTASVAQTSVTAVQPATCPVNPRSGCIGCHMPNRGVFVQNGNKIPISMADHYIRIQPRSR